MKLDFGSGFAPCPGWATLDEGENCTFNSIDQLQDDSISRLRFRNVLHHIEDMESLFKALMPKLRKRSKIVVIECRREYFKANVCLDILWYRFFQYRPMYIAPQYRDYTSIIEKYGFTVQQRTYKNEKEEIVFVRR